MMIISFVVMRKTALSSFSWGREKKKISNLYMCNF